MRKHAIILGALTALATFPALAQERTQGGAVGGAAAGAAGGALVGGPVGAVVGGVAGAVAGGSLGALSEPDREYVTTYVRKNRHNSVKIDGQLAVGAVIPPNVQFYRIEGRPGVDAYSYTYLNDRPVIVEPSSRKVIYIIE